jgi:hypothetical protein
MEILFSFHFEANNYWTTGIAMQSFVWRHTINIPASSEWNIVRKSTIRNVVMFWNFEVISDKFNVVWILY